MMDLEAMLSVRYADMASRLRVPVCNDADYAEEGYLRHV